MENNNYQNNNDYQNGQNYNQPNGNYEPQNNYQNLNQPITEPHGKAKAFGIVSLVCGIVSLVGCFVTFEFGIPGIVFGVLAKKASRQQGVENKMANIGFILSIIGLIVGAIALIAFIVFLVVIIFKTAGNASSYSGRYHYYYY